MCNTTCTFIIDTGADISIFKRGKIDNNQIYYPNNTCTIQGITGVQKESIGATKTHIKFDSTLSIEHTFQIVANDFPLDADAILGLDFLTKHRAIIDYDTWILTININNILHEIPILDGPTRNTILIPPRCEVIRKLNNQFSNDIVIPGQEIQPGIFLAGSIISPQNPLVKILNTTSSTVKIKNLNPQWEHLSDYSVYNNTDKLHNRQRMQKLLKTLNVEHVPEYAIKDLKTLCREFADIFNMENEPLTTNNFYSQHIQLSDNSAVYTKNYRIPEAHKTEINRQVKQMLDDDIIEHSTSHFNSPILLVPKKSSTGDKKWRLVVDFRNLNKKVVADKFPLPRIDEILDQMGRAKYFSTLDLLSGFHQIPLKQSSRKYTAFSTNQGHYQFTRLPFGLNISPNSFQRMMTIALSGLSPDTAFLYIDDIIVTGCSKNHHLKNLTSVFQCLRAKNLKLNPDKCKFFQSEVTYLGHQISAEGIQPDPSKFEVIKQFPVPKNPDEVRRFVAFCNYYRRFVPNFAEIALPLNQLLRKNVKFEWTPLCSTAFDILKTILMSPPILQYPDFKQQFTISTDASENACGAILSQTIDGTELPIAFASKTFTKGEKNKSTIEKELTAIHWAIMYFKPYVYGRHFIVRTDHRPLIYLFGMKNPSSKLTRMRLDLEEYQFDIQYIKGKENIGPDTLSRIELDITDLTNLKNILQIQTRAMTKNTNQSKLIHNTSENHITNKNMQPDQLHVFEVLSPNEVVRLPELKLRNIKIKILI